MTTIELVRFASCPSKPWANGGGSTRVLVSDADDLGEWTYRVSVAELAGHQPFSRFDGVDRHLTFLGPGSLRMSLNEIDMTLERGQGVRFAGEVDVTSEPSEPSARDLNVMVRRGVWTLRVTQTVGVVSVAAIPRAVVMWISLRPDGVVDESPVGELDVAVLRGGAPIDIEGTGLLCEICAPG